jgi:hypothetical protein
MSMLGVMRGAVSVGPVFFRLRREVHFDVVDTDSTTEVQTITPLEDVISKHRNVKAHIPFSTLNPSCRKDFYGRAAKYYNEYGGGIVTLNFFCRGNRSKVRSLSPLLNRYPKPSSTHPGE